MSTYTKMSRRDFVREGFCPTLIYCGWLFEIMYSNCIIMSLFKLSLLYQNLDSVLFNTQTVDTR